MCARYPTRSCSVFVGLVRPGRNAADVICPTSGNQHENATVRRDGSVQRQDATEEQQNSEAVVAKEQRADSADPGGAVAAVEVEEERGWERTSAGSRQVPNTEIVFKCVDAETTVVVGSTVEEREGRFIGGACPEEASVSSAATVDEISTATNPDNSTGVRSLQEEEHSAATTPLHEEEGKRKKRKKIESSVDNGYEDDDALYAGGAPGAISTAAKSVSVTISDSSNGEEVGDEHDQHQPSSMPASHPPPPTATTTGITAGSRPPTQPLGAEEVRPQVCVPIVGAGDSGCIGVVVIQGFTTGALIDDDNWRDWFVHRMDPLNRGENRNVKRLKLVRPRGLPEIGKLEHVPTGTAAKVVYGSVEKISRKRGMPVYSVR